MTTTSASTLVSIGMPVRNEATYIAQALDSLISQSGVQLEIIISDNASTDSTGDICREYAQRYPGLIRYHRFDSNVGPSANFAWVLRQARGNYFIWASGHDLWDADYLLACSKALDTHPGAMIAFGSTRWINGSGAPHGRETGWSDTRGLSPVARYLTVMWGNMNPVIGLLRVSGLRNYHLSDMVGMDLCILLHMALQGDFIHCPEAAWSRREFRDESSYRQKLQRYRSKDFALDRSLLARYFPLLRLPLRIFRDLYASNTSAGRKLLLTVLLLVCLPVKYLSDRSHQASPRQHAGSDSSKSRDRKEPA